MSGVRLLPLGEVAIRALAEGDFAGAARSVPVPLPPFFGRPEWVPGWGRARARLDADPRAAAWLAHVIWDEHRQLVVGRAGFHDLPDPAGRVEVTYGVEPEYRRQGYARAALKQLLARSVRAPEVVTVRAVIRPDNVPSRRLVAQCGFVEVPEHDEPGGPWVVYEFDAR
ncbi:GNAT family N-acetyltransferase [Amycolatopsis sacchari]|uniref:GNAT family N-acetyltransferase n=1 Tax=Amycolatopsis sacchari TaxID=115433 RepID=UPI003D702B0E